tara:strand:+ start:544 stop:651 length:108 start_codon:yes stop_codon:yes gene_type:complete
VKVGPATPGETVGGMVMPDFSTMGDTASQSYGALS